MSRSEALNEVVRTLRAASPDIIAAAVLSDDGLVIASSLPGELNEVRVGGMTATMLNLGTRAAHELQRGQLQELVLRGAEGYAAVMSANNGMILLCLSSKSARLGMLFLEMRKSIDDLAQIS